MSHLLLVVAAVVGQHVHDERPATGAHHPADFRQSPGRVRRVVQDERQYRRVQLAVLAEMLDERLRRHVASQRGQADKVQLDQETIDKLKALGYVQ